MSDDRTMLSEEVRAVLTKLPDEKVYLYWAQCNHWPLEDAIRLVLGERPRLVQKQPPSAKKLAQIELLRQMAINCFGASLQPVSTDTPDGEIHVKPVEFMKWAAERGIRIPTGLDEAFQQDSPFGYGYEPPGLRIEQAHRYRCQGVAALLWEQTPTLKKREVAEHPAIRTAGCQGKEYAISTIEKWIKAENPNRRPGRRPKSPET